MLNSKKTHIAISGRSGCGNTTISRKLAKILGFNLVNYTFRSIAQEEGLTFEEVARRAELSTEYDLRVDEIQVKLAQETSSVLGSRLAIWKLPDADLKVFLTASPEIRSARIQKREGGKMDDIIKITLQRDTNDSNRYKKLYGIDNNNYSFADIVINTEKFHVDQIVAIIHSATKSIIDKKKYIP